MGDVNRISKTFVDGEVTSIFWDLDAGKLNAELTLAFKRPAYAYTKSAVGGIHEFSNVR